MASYVAECPAAGACWCSTRVRFSVGWLLASVLFQWQSGQCNCNITFSNHDRDVISMSWESTPLSSFTSRYDLLHPAPNYSCVCTITGPHPRVRKCIVIPDVGVDPANAGTSIQVHATFFISPGNVTMWLIASGPVKSTTRRHNDPNIYLQVAMDVLGVMITCATCDFVFMNFMDAL